MHRYARHGIVLLHDVLAAAGAFALALFLRLGFDVFQSIATYAAALALFTAIATTVFFGFGLYRGVWRYASVADLTKIVNAVSVAVGAFLVAMFLTTRLAAIPRSTPVITWFILICALAGSRALYRWHKSRDRRRLAEQSAERVLLVGAGDEAELFIRALKADPSAGYAVVGVIDHKQRRIGRRIHDVEVIGGLDEMEAIVDALDRRGLRPARLILTKPPASYEDGAVPDLLRRALALGMHLSSLPNLVDFKHHLNGETLRPEPIAIEDLLGRPELRLDRVGIARLVAGRRVLVTGAGGTIGGELSRQIAALGPAHLSLVELSEFALYSIDLEAREIRPDLSCSARLCDVRERDRVMRVFAEERPDLVFHAAALKHVPMSEANVRETVLTNVAGTRNVADAACACSAAAMVLISTDKAINPTNVMGATKRLAEICCQALDVDRQSRADGRATRFMTVRFGNVLGSTGSVVPLFQRQLARGGPLTVTHPDIKRYFMTVREAVELVLQASAHGVAHPDDRGKIFVLDMGKPIRIADLARQMIRLAGLEPDRDVGIAYTGLRPGEKLFEELFSDSEPPTPAGVDGVLVAAPETRNAAAAMQAVDDMEFAARNGMDDDGLVTLLARFVPEFVPETRRSKNPPAAATA